MLLLLCLASCSADKDIRPGEKIPVPREEDVLFDPELRSFGQNKNAVLLLLPLSGRNGDVGQSILNACLLGALNSRNVDFHVLDTADSSIEKFKIYDDFKDKNLKAVIGPVFASETKQYAALFPKIPILSLSNDARINGEHVFACGLSPRDEIRSLLKYADSEDANSFLVILPNGEVGDGILAIISDELKKRRLGDDAVEVLRYQSISRKTATRYAQNSGKEIVFAIDPVADAARLKNVAVFTLSSAVLSNPEAWNGAIFAFFGGRDRPKFENKYASVFGMRPTAPDIIGYDLVGMINESVNGEIPLTEINYQGCSGKILLNKKYRLRRTPEIFRMKNSQKIRLTPDDAAEDA
ncbi:MAG: penicillin-binding protein activator [Holosporaceae bacterium]|nr:penicillin-binding protein activator [Holosporaceae bacterium]